MKKLKFKLIIVAVLLVAMDGFLYGLSPLNVIKQSNRKVLRITKGKDKLNDAQQKKMMQIIDEITAFSEMAKNVTKWFKHTPTQTALFHKTFKELLRVSSLKKAGRYRADRFSYQSVQVTGRKAIVKTIAYYNRDKVYIDYELTLIMGAWKITNYVIDDISTLRNYRKQFQRLFKVKSFQAVISRLESRINYYKTQY